jgi:hypothetical protein
MPTAIFSRSFAADSDTKFDARSCLVGRLAFLLSTNSGERGGRAD